MHIKLNFSFYPVVFVRNLEKPRYSRSTLSLFRITTHRKYKSPIRINIIHIHTPLCIIHAKIGSQRKQPPSLFIFIKPSHLARTAREDPQQTLGGAGMLLCIPYIYMNDRSASHGPYTHDVTPAQLAWRAKSPCKAPV